MIMLKYIAKPHTTFDEGTEAFPVEVTTHNTIYARFRGIRYGEMRVEMCKFTEFNQVLEDDDADKNRI